jgi:Domain of unknown function DUF488
VNLRECHLDRNPWNSSLWLGVEPAGGGRISISSSCPAQFVMTRHPLPQVSQWSPGTIFTIGHSTLSIERFIALVHAYGIERLADVRTVPRSRHNPQFNSDKLGPSLKQENIDYVPLQSLGGLRHPRKDSPNAGWRNESFRGFADYMQTEGFQEAAANPYHNEPRHTHRHHVCGSSALALPPLAGCRRHQCSRHPGY